MTDPYFRRASSPDTEVRLSPTAGDSSRQAPSRAYPFRFMPLTRPGAAFDTIVPSSNVDPKKARIEAEKGRREELRDKFASLRDALPMEGQKASKINILDRVISFIVAISYIGELKATVQEQESQLSALRLRLEHKKEKFE
ncbi:hypothetical protein QFC24_004999 [Naganishia onofrii]|uniref:Uncharacterized protein n=1 Tax=Naganishia onofrii TaxID=1851511 RepID=A0ACC2XB30_9TREE|nr:hypothetical protein QFC24_004999 [Naganishia onofrii]